jgi:hypothetical protein
MSDELERRLREAGHRLPGPTESDTLTARTAVLATISPARQAVRRRTLALSFAVVLVVAGAFGVGYGVAGSGRTVTRIVHVKARLDAGPGFLPAPGWRTVAAGDTATATSDGTGTRIDVQFSPAYLHRGVPERLLPLRLPGAGGRVRHVVVRVGATAIDATITFGTGYPDPALLVAAREELGRLVVPSCPAARPLHAGDAAAAMAYVLRWLPAHYTGNPADVAGATATAKAGSAAPRHSEAAFDCGAVVGSRTVEVDIVLPRIAKVSASLSELTYFAAKTSQGWTVWERAR